MCVCALGRAHTHCSHWEGVKGPSDRQVGSLGNSIIESLPDGLRIEPSHLIRTWLGPRPRPSPTWSDGSWFQVEAIPDLESWDAAEGRVRLAVGAAWLGLLVVATTHLAAARGLVVLALKALLQRARRAVIPPTKSRQVELTQACRAGCSSRRIKRCVRRLDFAAVSPSRCGIARNPATPRRPAGES
jgi:hypothetical protein